MSHDSLRAWVFKDGKYSSISAKVQPILKKINKYLKDKKFKEADADKDNVLGLKAEDLFPDHQIPHFRVSDNIVSGYSRGEKGYIVFENATKTTTQEDEEILLPLLQPTVEIAVEVARHLKAHYKPKDRICPGTPGGFYRVWKRIVKECGFKFLNPRNWKHSYATNGGEHLDAWYNGDTKLLQLCCLHSSFKMTEKYIKKRYPKNLMAWAPKK